jgi:predicted nicotinamide N-methyase
MALVTLARKCAVVAMLSRASCALNGGSSTRTLAIGIEGLTQPVRTLEVRSPDELLHDGADLATDECDVYGACLWPSSYAVATHLVRLIDQYHTRYGCAARVVELGCGAAALPALTALAAGAEHVVAADWSELALELVERSAFEFQPERADRLHAEKLNVRSATQWTALPWSCTHLVCADMLYEEQTAHAVGACVAHAVSQGAIAVVADPGRLDGVGRDHFFQGLRSIGGDAPWCHAQLSFREEHVPKEHLQSFGASLSWCGERDATVGILSINPNDLGMKSRDGQ